MFGKGKLPADASTDGLDVLAEDSPSMSRVGKAEEEERTVAEDATMEGVLGGAASQGAGVISPLTSSSSKATRTMTQKAHDKVHAAVAHVQHVTSLPVARVNEEWTQFAMQWLQVTIVECRAVDAHAPVCVVQCEGSTWVTDAGDGPNTLWSVPLKEGQTDPFPRHNHFIIPVVDVCNALLHIRIHDASSTLKSGVPIAHAEIAVSSLLTMGGGVGKEVCKWLALQSFDDTYHTVKERLGGLEAYLAGDSKASAEVHAPLGFVQVRVGVHFQKPGPTTTASAGSSVLRNAIPSILFAPAYTKDEETALRQTNRALPAVEGEEHPVDVERLRSLVARARRVLHLPPFFGKALAWPGVLILVVMWYHLCFHASVWQYPLVVLLLLAATAGEAYFSLQAARKTGGRSVVLLSKSEIAPPRELRKKAKQINRVVEHLQALLESLVPTMERLHYALSFHDKNVSLLLAVVLTGVCLAASLVLLVFPLHWVVFALGNYFLIPVTVRGFIESLFGKYVDVFELKVIQARGLAAFDLRTSDPYVKADCPSAKGDEVRTQVQHSTLEPKWNETFRIMLASRDIPIRLDMFDKNVSRTDAFMGRVDVSVENFGPSEDKWFPLQQGQGELQIGLRFLGSTFERLSKGSSTLLFREWPIVKRVMSIVKSLFPRAWHGLLTPGYFLKNLIAKMPTYNRVRSLCVSEVAFFNDDQRVVPRPK